jgi:xanthine dehydrogenase YagS FAD-binding subunit
MNKFSWCDAKSVDEALRLADSTVSEALNNPAREHSVLKSGGIDVLDLMKEGLISPVRVVNILQIPGLDGITFDKKTGLRIGANTRLSAMEEDANIVSLYTALHQAVTKAATPQLRNASTLGGNLAQRTRCWYFRSIDHPCFRKGGSTCFAQNGENQFHAIMNNGTCCSVHASSIATALLAFDARVEIAAPGGAKREVGMGEFFVTPFTDIRRENVLRRDELITAVLLPPPAARVKSYYIKEGERDSFDWALADVAVVIEFSGNNCKSAAIALGAAAPVPIRAAEAEALLAGKNLTADLARAVAESAMRDATPLEKNAYKVATFKTIIRRALMNTV